MFLSSAPVVPTGLARTIFQTRLGCGSSFVCDSAASLTFVAMESRRGSGFVRIPKPRCVPRPAIRL
jgi:hypothetical protein